MKRLSAPFCIPVLVVAVALAGCGDEPSNVAKLPTFKKGGNVRFINVSDAAVDAHVDEQEACTNLGFGKVAGPRLTALGEHELRASAGGTQWSEKLRVESGETLTVYVVGTKPEFLVIRGDPVTPPAGETLVRAVNLAGGDPVTFSMSSSGNDKALGDLAHGTGGETLSVSAGAYTFTARSADKVLATAEASFKVDETHTVLLAMQDGKPVLLVIHNNPLMIPTQSGASGA